MTFSEILRKLRKERRMSQMELAEMAGISQTSIYYWEKGERNPKIEQLRKIADVLNVSVGELIGRPEEEIPWGVSPEHPIAYPGLEQKIAELGYYIQYGIDYPEYSDNAIWIDYPDGGHLDITMDDLDLLNDETDSYLKFRLEELRRKKQK